MKSNKNGALRIISLLCIFLVIMLPVSFAVSITNLHVEDSGTNAAFVKWTTDVPATSEVKYKRGTFLTTARGAGTTTSHNVVLSSLVFGTSYPFTATSCSAPDDCVSESSEFVAGGGGVITNPSGSSDPLNVDIPPTVNVRALDIIGTTKPFATIELYVNDMSLPKRVLNPVDTGASGRIAFRGIILEEQNTIKLVAIDQNGGRSEKTFQVAVDIFFPVVTINDIPSFVHEKELVISGTVSEPVTVKIFTSHEEKTTEEATEPAQVENLRIETVEKNFVDIEWDKVDDDDFSHYIVYRGGIGSIATLSPKSNNKYTDTRVDSGASYTYTVAYMNTFGKTGEESAPLRVDTLPGGFVTGIKPVRIDPNLDSTTPQAQQDVAGGAFSVPVNLDKEGKYSIKIELSDSGGNRETFLRSVTLDTKPPKIKIISPPSGSTIFENFAEDMDIKGETDPGARVHLFVGRTPFNTDNLSFDLNNLKDDLINVSDDDLDEDCRPDFSGHNVCPTGADYSTTADAEGKFDFENVDASGAFSGIVETSIASFSRDDTRRSTRDAKLLLIAQDKSGLRSVKELKLRIGTCWSGNLSWDIVPLQEFQSPTFLSTERLAEGAESIYFYFNYSYIGPGESASIRSVSLTKACGKEELLEDRYQIGCDMLGSGGRTIKLNKDGTVSYSAVKLKRVKGMENWFEGEWKDFFESINNEVSFPFKVLINYEHDVNGETNRESQATCQELTYVVDNSRIDPRKVLPDWLLYDFVEFLDKTIEDIASIQESLDSLVQLASVGCFASFAANFIVQFWRRFTIFTWELKTKAENFWNDAAGIGDWLGIGGGGVDETTKANYCQQLVKAMNDDRASYSGGFKMKYLSDADLKECFPEVHGIWETEHKTYQALRWTCDRLFGHTTPSRWTELKTDEELRQKAESGKTCDSDEDVQGYPLRPVPCSKITGVLKTAAEKHPDTTCFLQTETVNNKRNEHLYVLKKEANANGIAELQRIGSRSAFTAETIWAVKINDGNYLTATTDDCATACGVTKDVQTSTADVRGNTVTIRAPKDKRGSKDVTGACMTAKGCMDLNKKVAGRTDAITINTQDGGTFTAENIFRRGYTNDCFYDGSDPRVVSSDPTTRRECCCFRGQGVKEESKFYDSLDMDVGPKIRQLKQEAGKKLEIHERAETGLSTSEGDHVPLAFSYRYFKNKFRAMAGVGDPRTGPADRPPVGVEIGGGDIETNLIHTAYNPNRYIEGRDQPACFGQDNWFYDTLRGEKSLLIIDPLQQWHSAIQCANLGGVQQRLTQLTNAMRLMSNCLKSVRETGEGNTGACKELFTQYVCQFFWDAIQFLTDDCSPIFGQFANELGDDELVDTLRGGFTSFFEAGTDLQDTVNDEYSNAKLNEMFGIGQEAIARKICLAAFGYDWDITPKGLVDASYTQPFSSLVQALTATREYLTVDPATSQSKFEYRASWVINPGCDIRGYDIKLACIDRDTLNEGRGADCTEQQSPDGVNCPCLDSNQKETSFFTKSRTIKQNAIVDEAENKIITKPYRYDHLKITLRPERKEGRTTISKDLLEKCFPQGYEDGEFYFPIRDRTGQDILQCQLEPLSGVYTCKGGLDFFEGKGSGIIESVKIDGEAARNDLEFASGREVEVVASVLNSGGDKCLRMKVGGQADKFVSVFGDGTFPYTIRTAPLPSTGTTSDQGGLLNIPQGVSVVLERRDNTVNVDFPMSFTDSDGDGNYDPDTGDSVIVDGCDISTLLSFGTCGDGTSRAEVTYGGGVFFAKKNGAEIRITGVNFRGDDNSLFKSRSGTVTVSARGSTTGSTTARTIQLELGLYHTKDDTQSSGSDASRCNFNSLVTNSGVPQRRTYRIDVV